MRTLVLVVVLLCQSLKQENFYGQADYSMGLLEQYLLELQMRQRVMDMNEWKIGITNEEQEHNLSLEGYVWRNISEIEIKHLKNLRKGQLESGTTRRTNV